MNVIARLEYELAYYDSTVHRFNHYTMRDTPREMKESVTKATDTLTQEDFHRAFKKLLEWYNKSIAAGGDYFEGD